MVPVGVKPSGREGSLGCHSKEEDAQSLRRGSSPGRCWPQTGPASGARLHHRHATAGRSLIGELWGESGMVWRRGARRTFLLFLQVVANSACSLAVSGGTNLARMRDFVWARGPHVPGQCTSFGAFPPNTDGLHWELLASQQKTRWKPSSSSVPCPRQRYPTTCAGTKGSTYPQNRELAVALWLHGTIRTRGDGTRPRVRVLG